MGSQVKAYVDGSYRESISKKASWGIAIVANLPNWTLGSDLGGALTRFPSLVVCGTQHTDRGVVKGVTLSRNIDGECEAVIQVLRWCRESAVDDVLIYNDYLGLSKWLSGEWQARSQVAVAYVSEARRLIQSSSDPIHVEFAHVKGHTGDPGNTLADALAAVIASDSEKESE